MAKKIKFPLEMKDGVKVRTIEELRQNFDEEKILTYYMNGKLLSWLSDRHYDGYLLKLKELDNSNKNLLEEICRILEIKNVNLNKKIDYKEIELKNDKLSEVKQYTDKKEILNNINLVATTQKEFESLIKKSPKIIYLCGKQFTCPIFIENITIEGINNPVVEINATEVIDFKAKNVVFSNIEFDAAYQELIEKNKYNIEHGNDKKNIPYHPSSLLDIRLSDDDRKQSEKLYSLLQKELVDVKFDVNANTKNLEKLLIDADLYNCFNIHNIGKKQKDCLKIELTCN